MCLIKRLEHWISYFPQCILYSHIPQQVLDEYNKNTETQQDDLFRIVMKLNTAKVMVVDPALYLGGEKEYVRSLFMDAGVRV